jgi:hypothetical protein
MLNLILFIGNSFSLLSSSEKQDSSRPALYFKVTEIRDTVQYDSNSYSSKGKFYYENISNDTLEVLDCRTSDPCMIGQRPKLISPHQKGYFEFLCPAGQRAYVSSTFYITYCAKGKKEESQTAFLYIRRVYKGY